MEFGACLWIANHYMQYQAIAVQQIVVRNSGLKLYRWKSAVLSLHGTSEFLDKSISVGRMASQVLLWDVRGQYEQDE